MLVSVHMKKCNLCKEIASWSGEVEFMKLTPTWFGQGFGGGGGDDDNDDNGI